MGGVTVRLRRWEAAEEARVKRRGGGEGEGKNGLKGRGKERWGRGAYAASEMEDQHASGAGSCMARDGTSGPPSLHSVYNKACAEAGASRRAIV